MPVAPVKKENTSPVLSAVEQDFLHRMSEATAKKNHNLQIHVTDRQMMKMSKLFSLILFEKVPNQTSVALYSNS